MPQIEIISEDDGPVSWTFTVQVLDDDGTLRRHEVALSWADYNLWSRTGGDEPAAVATAVVQFMLAQLDTAAELPKSFDASIARRRYRSADQEIPALIR